MTPDEIEALRVYISAKVAAGMTMAQVCDATGANYPRVRYYLRTIGAVPNSVDLSKLVKYFWPGYAQGWRLHPTAPGWYYKDQTVLTEKQLRDLMVAEPAAAE